MLDPTNDSPVKDSRLYLLGKSTSLKCGLVFVHCELFLAVFKEEFPSYIVKIYLL